MKVLISGASGAMGKKLAEACARGVCGADAKPVLYAKFDASEGMYTELSDVTEKTDVLIDFSFHTGISEVLDYCLKNKLPAVICTTGHSPEEEALIHKAAEQIPVFHSGNMSVGVAALVSLAKQATALFPGADIEIVETHHNRKVDAPSGTAVMIAKALKEVRPESTFHEGRSGMCKREKNEIGIQAIRMGNIVGIHEVMINTGTEQISLKHEAFDRALFADGALAAAAFLMGKGPGFYDMTDLTASH